MSTDLPSTQLTADCKQAVKHVPLLQVHQSHIPLLQAGQQQAWLPGLAGSDPSNSPQQCHPQLQNIHWTLNQPLSCTQLLMTPPAHLLIMAAMLIGVLAVLTMLSDPAKLALQLAWNLTHKLA